MTHRELLTGLLPLLRRRQDYPRGGCWIRGSASLAVAVLLGLPAALAAQGIRGVVLEGNTTSPVVGASIEVLRSDSTLAGTATSDRQGWFSLDVAAGGTYLLRPAHPSYTAEGVASVVVGKHEIVTVALRMGPAAIPLERLVVTARSRDRLAGFYERAERERLGRFIMRDAIERRMAARPSDLLRMTPGVRLERSEDGLANIITLRGPGGRCTPEVFLDGLPVAQDIGMSIDEFTATELLEGVEIYDSYARLPPELPVFVNECGVIAFWSRREAFRPFSWKRVLVGGLIAGAIVLLYAR